MKFKLHHLIVAFAFIYTCRAKSQSVDVSLTNAYTAIESAKTYPQYLLASNQFKLIAKQNPTNWLCNYYAAWSIATISFQEPSKDNRDLMLDEADAFFKKIEAMDSSNDEIAVLGGLLAQARAEVAPVNRHGKYEPIINAYFAKAKKINPDNPRIYFLQGNSLFIHPKFWVAALKKLCPCIKKRRNYLLMTPAL